uniref:Uncharacterized protein n=1 Tax=Plectus sambesii TaxID=2011161 RepID=A0A914WFB9_9BILA
MIRIADQVFSPSRVEESRSRRRLDEKPSIRTPCGYLQLSATSAKDRTRGGYRRYVRALLDPRRDHRPPTKRIRIERKWEEGVRGRRLETASAVKRADEGGFVRAGCLRWLSGAKMSAGVRSVCNSRAVRPAAFCRQRRKAANIREDAHRGRMSKNGVRPPRLSDLSRVFQPSDYGTV